MHQQDPHRPATPSASTSAELRGFLSQMRGKSPKEMLGAIASSNLFQSTLTATAAISAAIVVFTIVPFGWKRALGDGSTPAGATSAAPAAPSKPLESPPEPGLDDIDKGKAASKLGIGESKEAPANINPLESATDDLLEGIE